MSQPQPNLDRNAISSLASDLIITNSITFAFLAVLSGSYFAFILSEENLAFARFGLLLLAGGILGNILTCLWAILFSIFTKTTLARNEDVPREKIALDIGLTVQGIILAFSNTIGLIYLSANAKGTNIPLMASNMDYQMGSYALIIFIAIGLAAASISLPFAARQLFEKFLLEPLDQTLKKHSKSWYRGIYFVLFHLVWIYILVIGRDVQFDSSFLSILLKNNFGTAGWVFIIVAIYILALQPLKLYVNRGNNKRRSNSSKAKKS
ncbi:MAG: hypothetical protein HYY22_09195 [Thaumarchaeota archaeon]|nr:hypothetical protein [Nitrososphaerota archaeon]